MIHCVHCQCAHAKSHMIDDVKLTQHNQGIAQLSLDPCQFGWGLGMGLAFCCTLRTVCETHLILIESECVQSREEG